MKIPEYLANLEIVQKAVACKKRRGFSDWLRTNLYDYYAPAPGRRSSLRLLEGRDDRNPVEALASIYSQALEAGSQQLAFRQSIGDVILMAVQEKGTPPALLTSLVYLTGRVRAVESVHSFDPLLTSCKTGEVQQDLLYRAMTNLQSLSPSPKVEETVTKIAEASYFDDGYLLTAIGILAECHPEKTLKLIKSYQPRITLLRETAKSLGGKELQAYRDCVDNLTEGIKLRSPTPNLEEVKKMLLPA